MDFMTSGPSPLKFWNISNDLVARVDRLLLRFFFFKEKVNKGSFIVQTKQNWDKVKMSSEIDLQDPPHCFSFNEILSD